MFTTYTDSVIDTVQTTKKSIVEMFGATTEIKKIFNDYIDAQTKYTKEAAQASISMNTKIVEVLMDRTPYIKAQEQFANFFPKNTVATTNKKKA